MKFLCDGSPRFKVEGETFQAKPGFNDMPDKFANDPYYDMCVSSGMIKDFVSNPTDRDMEGFQAQIQAERERADAATAERDALKAKLAALENPDDGKKSK